MSYSTKSNIKEHKCKCQNIDGNEEYCDNIAYILTLTKLDFSNEERIQQFKDDYNNILNLEQESFNLEDNLKQIEKDLSRTYPSSELFQTEEGQKQMKNVLIAFSKYDKDISKLLFS